MAVARSCDHCGFHHPSVKRYGLSRQIPMEERRENRPGAHRMRRVNAGGIDLCDRCWEEKAGPKRRVR